VELSLALRGQIWRTQDWFARLVELEWDARRISDPWQRSQAYLELARVTDGMVPDRQRALLLYQRAWQATGECISALTTARAIYRELGDLPHAAEVAEVEYRYTQDPTLLAIAGETWLDAGDAARAAPALARALEQLGDEDLKDALATARRINGGGDDLSRLEREANVADHETASRKLLHAALVIRAIHPTHPLYESLLRRSLDQDSRNHRAATLLDFQLEREERWVEYIELQEMRADTAPSDRERVDIFRRTGIALVVRCKQARAGARLLATALAIAYERQVEDIPGHIAMLALLRTAYQATDQSQQMCAIYDRALQASLSEDERLFISSAAGKMAWKQLDDLKRAERYFATVKSIVPDHPLVQKFERSSGQRIAGNRRVAEAEQSARRVLQETEQALAGIDTRRYIETSPIGKEWINQRREDRVPSSNVVKVTLAAAVNCLNSEGSGFTAFTRDLSETGIFIKTEHPVEVGAVFRVMVRIPSAEGWGEECFDLSLRVVRIEKRVGFAAAIDEPPAEYRAKVQSLLE
jgi:hypothetical protein